MSRIFLSHSSRDDLEAVAFRDWLASEGWEDVFLDLDPDRGIEAGQRWERRLYEAASRCEAVIFLVSDAWLASGWCLKEYTTARRLNKKLFAVLIEPTTSLADLPPELTDTWQVTDLAGGQDMRLFHAVRPGSHEEKQVGFSRDGLNRLKRGLQKAGLDARFFAWPPATELDRAPYRGLQPLEAADAGIFFGRDAPVVDAIDRLRGVVAGAAPRLFVILGASGAGKSSFLRAGLLPRLARDDTHFVPLPPIRPERAALTGENGLLRALEVICVSRTRAELRSAVLAGAAGIRPLLEEVARATFQTLLTTTENAKPPTIVIAIDQAEELFRSEGANESAALLDLIRDLTATDEPAVVVIFAIRSDAYDILEHAKPLEGLRQEAFPLLPMPRAAYKDVIEGPAQRVAEAGGRLTIEPQLTQRLLDDVETGGGSDALPLLAFSLEQLYLEYQRAGILRLTDYTALGGLRGAIDAAVQRAFARADMDARIPREHGARESLLRRGLIPWLAGIDPETRAPRRNIARLADIPAEAAPLINLLVEERLLSTDVECLERDSAVARGATTIEPAHEVLLRQWGLLDNWLAQDFGLLATLEGLRRAARDWDANGRKDGWLAHRGQRLTEAQALNERPDIVARLDPRDRAYKDACKHTEDVSKRRIRRARASSYAFLICIIVVLVGWINQAYLVEQVNWFARMRPYMLAEVRPHVLSIAAEQDLRPGDQFRECARACPDMVVLPAGRFAMGSTPSDTNRRDNEEPQHAVSIPRVFAVSKFDVTFDDWEACERVGGCPAISDGSYGRGTKPAINVTWDEAQQYVTWLSTMTGKDYRLPTEAEWEYAARAGSRAAYYWGDEIGSGNANCNGCGSKWDGRQTSPVGSFRPNAFGLYDMAGNVLQWVQDCDHANYMSAPADGTAWTTQGCGLRVTRGGSWFRHPPLLRSGARLAFSHDVRLDGLGFRVVRALPSAGRLANGHSEPP